MIYDDPPSTGPLRQGEILAEIWEFRPLVTPVAASRGMTPEVVAVYHPFTFIMSADCDLEQDFKVRFGDQPPRESYEEAIRMEGKPAIISHVLLYEGYDGEQLLPRVSGSDIRRRIKQNQDERDHFFASATIGNSSSTIPKRLPDLCLDFKKTLALPTHCLYNDIINGGINRVAIVPPFDVHDLMHRFYAFLSRVALHQELSCP